MNQKELVNLMITKGYKIAMAESCTGGLLASSIVDVADASKVLDMSFITYSNDAKINLVNVNKTTIEKYNVVSEEVAIEMAIGCSKRANSQIGVGISGIAGPTGDDISHPIGMVCFGFYIAGQIYSATEYFGDIGRNKVRTKAVDFAINFLIKQLSN